MDKDKIIEIATRYAVIVQKRFSPISIILFGSYSKGTATENSDIDIAVIVEKIENDYLNETAALYKLTREIDDRIEPILLEKGEDKSGFMNEIQKTGIVLFQLA